LLKARAADDGLSTLTSKGREWYFSTPNPRRHTSFRSGNSFLQKRLP